MHYAPNNPKTNALGAGITEDQIRSAVVKSGYPLQTIVNDLLRSIEFFDKKKFGIQEEWSYVDGGSDELRNIDLLAELRLHDWDPQPRVRPSLDLLIECKQSLLPYIFFETTKTPFLSSFMTIAGLPKDEIVYYR